MWMHAVDNGISKRRIQDLYLDMLVHNVGVLVKGIMTVDQKVSSVELKILL